MRIILYINAIIALHSFFTFHYKGGGYLAYKDHKKHFVQMADSIPLCERLKITMFKDVNTDSKDDNKQKNKPVSFGSAKISGQYGNHVKEKPDYDRVKKWICETFETLIQEEKRSEAEEAHLTIVHHPEYDFYKEQVRLYENKLMTITFSQEERLFCKTTSYYTDTKIGDITVCIDNKMSSIYMNRGHVCGGTIDLVVTKPTNPKSVEVFLKEFRSETDDICWKKFDL